MKKYQKGPQFKTMSNEEVQVMIDKFASALFDLVDGNAPWDLVDATGLSMDQCTEIHNLAYEWWNNSK